MEQLKVTKRWDRLNLAEGAPLDLATVQKACKPNLAPLSKNSTLYSKAPRPRG
jgi:hypothetical protein